MLEMLKQYNGDSVYLAVFAGSLLILALAEDKKASGRAGLRAVLSVLIAVAVLYNGIAYRLIGKLTDTTTYYRFFWMLPVIFVIAYVITTLYTGKNKWYRIGAAGLLVLCMGIGCNVFIRPANMHKITNVYGLKQDTIEIADAITEDFGQTKLQDADGPVVAFDLLLQSQIRSYEPTIRWGISRNAYLWQAENGFDYENGRYKIQQRIIAAVSEGKKEDAAKLRHSIDNRDIDYLVIRTEYDMDAYLQTVDIVPIYRSELYTLYKVLV